MPRATNGGAGGREAGDGDHPEAAGTTVATTAHCALCFDTLLAEFGALRKADIAALPDAKESFPFFVTWNIAVDYGRRGGEAEELRGCIGTLSAQPLSKLQRYAITSAFDDRRFNPMEPDEVSRLTCRVSLLVDYERAASWNDWTVGVHGILIHFTDSRGNEYSATYLPEVASEQGWDHATAIDSLVRKAGCRETPTDALRRRIELTRYKSSKAALSFKDYCALRGFDPADVASKLKRRR